jgi:hypothetical protein
VMVPTGKNKPLLCSQNCVSFHHTSDVTRSLFKPRFTANWYALYRHLIRTPTAYLNGGGGDLKTVRMRAQSSKILNVHNITQGKIV